ncbi:hypothetical protein BH09VER1_BH09VER1_31180 [soil metagenome]
MSIPSNLKLSPSAVCNLSHRMRGKLSAVAALGLLFTMALSPRAVAAIETWVGTTSDWGTASNWNLPNVPVAADTAIFNTGTGLAVSLNGVNRNVRFINFDSNAGSFTFGATGAERLILTSAGGISILSTVTGTNLTETFAVPITMAGSVVFTNARLDVGTSLQFTGNITNSAVSTLTINGAGTGTANLISGNISDGTGVQSVTLSHTAGVWTLSGTNSYSGLTTISGAGGTTVMAGSNSSSGATTLSNATLQLAGGSNGGLASGTLTLTSGTLQAVGATRSLSNAVTMTAVTVSGTQSLNLNGKLTGLTGASRILTSSITNGGTLTLGDVDINTETANARSLTIAGTGNTTITGTIANGNGTTANSLVVSNTGTTTLSGANTYTGTTTLSAGTVVLGNKAALGTSSVILNATTLSAASNLTGTSAVANNYGSTSSGGITSFIGTNSLEFSGVNTSNISHTFNNNIAGGTLILSGTQILSTSVTDFGLTVTGSGNTVISGPITNGTGGSTGSKLIYSGNGLLTLSGANTYSGSTAISNGKVNVTGLLGNTVVSVNGGGSLGGSGNGTTTGVIGTGTGGSVVVAGGTTAATRGTIDLVDGSIGTLTINGASGANTLTLGSATAGINSVLNFETGTNSTDLLAIGNSGKLLLNLGGASINLSALSGQTLANGTYNLITFATSSTLTGAFNLASPSTVGASRYLLNGTSTSEQLIVTNNVATGNVYWTGLQGSTWESFTSGTSNFVTGPSSTTDAGVPSSTSNVFFTANSGTNLATTIQNDYVINSLNYTGVGTSGTGATTIAGSGTITLNATSTNGNTSGVGITVQAGSGTQTISTKIALGQSQTWVNNSTINLQLNNANTTIGAGQSLTLTGTAAGFSFITSNSILGSGTLVVNTSASFGSNAANNSSFNGTILLNSGNISLNGGGSGSSSPNMLGAGSVLIINGGTITAGGNIANGGGVTGIASQVWNGDWTQFSNGKTLVLGGTVSLGTAAGTTRNVTVNGNTAIFSATGVISDGTFANSITKSGLGTMRLTGVNTFSGTTSIAAGSLVIDANSGNTTLALQNSTLDLNAVDTGTLSFGSSTSTTINAATFGGLKGSRNLGLVNTGTGALSSAIALTIGGNNSSQTYSGTLSGVLGSVTKVGSGTQTFTAANTYTGTTTVSAGTLLVNGSGVGVVQVDAGTLGGSGTISNTVTVADGATVAPGSGAVGTLSTGDFTLSGSTSTLAMELSGTGAGASDRINVTGAVNLNGNGQIALTLVSYTPTAGDLIFLIVNDNTDAINGTLFGLAQGATFSSGGYNWQISYTADSVGNTFTGGNDLALIAAVPEPATWALLGCGAMALLIFRRRVRS